MLTSNTRAGGMRRGRLRSALVGIQAALCVTLLVGTGLVGRSLYNVRAIDLGLDVNRVITVSDYDTLRRGELRETAVFAASLPGVTGVALTAATPLHEQLGARYLLSRTGDTVRAAEPGGVGYVAADFNYLNVVGTPVLRGRYFTADDRFGSPPVMIVNEELARRVWPGRDPIGQCLRIDRIESACYGVVGVARNSHVFYVIEAPRPVFYVPIDQRPDRAGRAEPDAGALVVRTSGGAPGAATVAARLRHALGDTATALRNRKVTVMSEMIDQQYDPWEIGARLFAGVAILALLVTGLGLYGVLSYLVAARTRELGIRLALGADRTRVMTLVINDGLRLISIGTVVGVAIALATAGRLSALLYQVSPSDPLVITAAVMALLVCVMLAATVPARRAMAIEPMIAIREE